MIVDSDNVFFYFREHVAPSFWSCWTETTLVDFIWTMQPLGRITGVYNDREIVWLPVARSQKARFASRKRIRAFQRGHSSRDTGRDHPWSLIYIAVNGVALIQIGLCTIRWSIALELCPV